MRAKNVNYQPMDVCCHVRDLSASYQPKLQPNCAFLGVGAQFSLVATHSRINVGQGELLSTCLPQSSVNSNRKSASIIPQSCSRYHSKLRVTHSIAFPISSRIQTCPVGNARPSRQ